MDNKIPSGADETKKSIGTTGHVWDGIEELNTPLPRWWLWTFYACIVWAFGYWIIYPAIPLMTSFTKGTFGWSSREAVVADLNELKTLRSGLNTRIEMASLDEIEKSPELLAFARAQGAASFAVNCSPCHGAGAQGFKGYPNLNDDDWIWGGKADAIHTTLLHGVRWEANPETRISVMPSFGRDGILKPSEISAVADYVLTLSGLTRDAATDLVLGKAVFATNCAACHSDSGAGNRELGVPNLSDQVWLYGSDKVTITERINLGGGGVMPSWSERLDAATLKSLAVYVHTLGGGE